MAGNTGPERRENHDGHRSKRVGPYLKGGESFCMTYRDGVDDIDGGEISWEWAPLEGLATYPRLPMDTLRYKVVLETFWHNGRAPWKRWA